MKTILANKAVAEEFIDTVCYELWIPLSAVFQLADDIVAAMESSATKFPTAETIESTPKPPKIAVLQYTTQENHCE